MVDFLDYMRAELPAVALALGQVICPPRPAGNRNRFCILWDTKKETPSSIAVEIGSIALGEKFFKLK